MPILTYFVLFSGRHRDEVPARLEELPLGRLRSLPPRHQQDGQPRDAGSLPGEGAEECGGGAGEDRQGAAQPPDLGERLEVSQVEVELNLINDPLCLRELAAEGENQDYTQDMAGCQVLAGMSTLR